MQVSNENTVLLNAKIMLETAKQGAFLPVLEQVCQRGLKFQSILLIFWTREMHLPLFFFRILDLHSQESKKI
jgi:hypothetical protein